MYLHLLNEQEQTDFLATARLICLSDNPVLWDGKTRDEITSETDVSKVAFQQVEAEQIVMRGFERECGREPGSGGSNFFNRVQTVGMDTETALLQRLRPLPLGRQNDPLERTKACVDVLQALALDDPLVLPASTKIMLFELMSLCLADGAVSEVEQSLLKEFCRLRGIEDYMFNDLFERAQSMSREIGKTTAIILE